tara:strand:- start:207 stop:452 length:246 start_codon:yes stop_codon:yes gene_type:complete
MRKVKLVALLTVLIGTAYPVFELTRVIIKYMIVWDMGTAPLHVYYAELVLIWALYLTMFWLISKAINLVWLMGREDGRCGN